MVSKDGGEASWHRPIPGNAEAIFSEIERLDSLKEMTWTTAEALRRLDPAWAGQAHDRFIEFRDALVRQWQKASDLHDDAAQALRRYHTALVEMQRKADELVRQADYGADPAHAPAAWTDIIRLRDQLHQLGVEAAYAIEACARALARIEAVSVQGRANVHNGRPEHIGTTSTPLSAPQQQTSTPWQPVAPEAINLDPWMAVTDPVAFKRNVHVLAAEVLVGEHYVMPTAQG